MCPFPQRLFTVWVCLWFQGWPLGNFPLHFPSSLTIPYFHSCSGSHVSDTPRVSLPDISRRLSPRRHPAPLALRIFLSSLPNVSWALGAGAVISYKQTKKPNFLCPLSFLIFLYPDSLEGETPLRFPFLPSQLTLPCFSPGIHLHLQGLNTDSWAQPHCGTKWLTPQRL